MKKFLKGALNVFLAALIGCVNGFFGGGGGMLCVPFLEKIVKLPTQKAVSPSFERNGFFIP